MLEQGYRPSIRRLQLDFAARVARKVMLERRERAGTRPPKSKITDNSEPWLENPGSVEDFLEISRRIKASKERWLSRFNGSSTS